MARQKKAPARKTRSRTTRGGSRKKSTARRSVSRPAPELLRDAWHQTVRALTEAEAEVERQIKGLLKRNRIKAPDASRALSQITGRIQKERRQAVTDFEARLKRVQKQVRKERRALDKMVEDAVQSTLASFNIPSRKEVTELTRKVNQLSRKLDGLPRRRARSAS
jgi:polyhydroxyalkanoate synthesis regulator phasin